MKSMKIFVHRIVRRLFAAGVPIAVLLSLTAAAQAADNVASLTQWREAIARVDAKAAGCAKASYPSMQWHKVECVAAPAVPFIPRDTRGGSLTVGKGVDFTAAVGPGMIRKTVGSFPKVTGVKTEEGIDGANSYSLEINSNYMRTKTCRHSKHYDLCDVWQQFIYSSDNAEAFMQYWLLNWGESCPTGWTTSFLDCYTSSAAVSVPKEVISKLKTLSFSGAAVEYGLDTLIMYVGETAYKTTGKDNVLYLATAWEVSEFNILGDGGGSEANFNTGSSITVKNQVTNGTKRQAMCQVGTATSGETNNLNLDLHSCFGKGGTRPFIEFTESN
jgi:hypothetical protein